MIFKMQESKPGIEPLGISFFILKFSSEIFLDQSEICASYTAGCPNKEGPGNSDLYEVQVCVAADLLCNCSSLNILCTHKI